MLCPRCHGSHYVLTSGRPLPCPECGGVGELNCCDGLMEQPDSAGFLPAAPNGAACRNGGGAMSPADAPRPD